MRAHQIHYVRLVPLIGGALLVSAYSTAMIAERESIGAVWFGAVEMIVTLIAFAAITTWGMVAVVAALAGWRLIGSLLVSTTAATSFVAAFVWGYLTFGERGSVAAGAGIYVLAATWTLTRNVDIEVVAPVDNQHPGVGEGTPSSPHPAVTMEP